MELLEIQPEEMGITDDCEQMDCEDCSKRNNCEPYQKGVNDLAFL